MDVADRPDVARALGRAAHARRSSRSTGTAPSSLRVSGVPARGRAGGRASPRPWVPREGRVRPRAGSRSRRPGRSVTLVPVIWPLTRRRAVDLCRVGSCLCRRPDLSIRVPRPLVSGAPPCPHHGPPPLDPRGVRFAAALSRPSCSRSCCSPAAAGCWPRRPSCSRSARSPGCASRRTRCCYRTLVAPRLSPPTEREDAAPVRFSQLVGFVFAVVGTVGYLTGLTALGVVATAFALVAAFLNAAFGFCLGCELYPLAASRLRPPHLATSNRREPPHEPLRRPGHRRLGREESRHRRHRLRRGRRGHHRLRRRPHRRRRQDRLEDRAAGPGPARLRRPGSSSTKLLSDKGIANDDTVVLYGGNNNWFAAYAYWYFKLYGHDDVKLLDGGRKKWELDGRPLTTDVTDRTATTLHGEGRRQRRSARSATRSSTPSAARTWSTSARPTSSPARSSRPRTCRRSRASGPATSPAPSTSRGARRPTRTARSSPTTTSPKLYGEAGLRRRARRPSPTAASVSAPSHTWFVLQELLGHDNVKNYDGSWTEYGSLVGVPIELGS